MTKTGLGLARWRQEASFHDQERQKQFQFPLAGSRGRAQEPSEGGDEARGGESPARRRAGPGGGEMGQRPDLGEAARDASPSGRRPIRRVFPRQPRADRLLAETRAQGCGAKGGRAADSAAGGQDRGRRSAPEHDSGISCAEGEGAGRARARADKGKTASAPGAGARRAEKGRAGDEANDDVGDRRCAAAGGAGRPRSGPEGRAFAPFPGGRRRRRRPLSDARRRSARQQHASHDGARRQGARGLHAAAGNGRDQIDHRRGPQRDGPLARPRRRILHVGAPARARGAGGAGRAIRQSVGLDPAALPGRAGRARRRAGPHGQAIFGRRVARQSLLRFHQAGLCADDALGGRSRQAGRRNGSARARQGAVLSQAGDRRALAVQLPRHQPRAPARDAPGKRREPRARSRR